MSGYETLDNINTTYYIESGDDDVKEIKDKWVKVGGWKGKSLIESCNNSSSFQKKMKLKK